MRVFHIITHFDIGGAERVAVNIAHSLTTDIEYHLVEVVKGEGRFNHELIKEFERAGIHYHCSFIRNNKWGIMMFPFWFLYLILKWKPQIIHTHTEIPDLSIYIWNILFGWMFPSVKYIRTIHNTKLWSQWSVIGDKVEDFFKNKHANIAISKSVQDCYKKVYEENPPIIFNGVASVEQWPFEHLVKDRINILFAGRLESQKGVYQLMEVVKALRDDCRFYFHIIGNGTMQKQVSQTLGGLKNVSLYDKIFGLNHYIGSFDFLFMPSNHEGLALMPIEASLAHTPTIINNIPGLKDTLPDDWPLKIENNNIKDFVQLILSLYDDTCYHKYVNSAYQFAMKFFSIERMQFEYEKIYRKGHV